MSVYYFRLKTRWFMAYKIAMEMVTTSQNMRLLLCEIQCVHIFLHCVAVYDQLTSVLGKEKDDMEKALFNVAENLRVKEICEYYELKNSLEVCILVINYGLLYLYIHTVRNLYVANFTRY